MLRGIREAEKTAVDVGLEQESGSKGSCRGREVEIDGESGGRSRVYE